MKKIKKIIKKIIYRHKSSSESYVKWLQKKGCRIGKNTYFFDPTNTFVDVNRPDFIEIGEKCKISSSVTILAHDYSYSVLRPIYNVMPQKTGVTKIGNNVFVGIHSIILMGADIGDNVIIGAGSVVHGKVESNSVYAGNPAKKISTIEKFYEKTMNEYEENAILHAKRLKKIHGRQPKIEEMGFFAYLFLERTKENKKILEKINCKGDNKDELVTCLMKYTTNKYKSFDDFLEKNNI